jgi:hypothetical protein
MSRLQTHIEHLKAMHSPKVKENADDQDPKCKDIFPRIRVDPSHLFRENNSKPLVLG